MGDLRCSLLCRSLVKACPALERLWIFTDIGTSRTVMKGLLAAQLGPSRTIRFYVRSKYGPFERRHSSLLAHETPRNAEVTSHTDLCHSRT